MPRAVSRVPQQQCGGRPGRGAGLHGRRGAQKDSEGPSCVGPKGCPALRPADPAGCGRRVKWNAANLHLNETLPVRQTSEDSDTGRGGVGLWHPWAMWLLQS